MKKLTAMTTFLLFSVSVIVADIKPVPVHPEKRPKVRPEIVKPNKEKDIKRLPRPINPDHWENSMNYRGRRIAPPREAFNITSVRCGKISNGKITLDLKFNQSVNPSSVNSENVYIDGWPLSESSQYMFSKNGNTVRITIAAPEEEFSLRFENIVSFSGEVLGCLEFKGLRENYTFYAGR